MRSLIKQTPLVIAFLIVQAFVLTFSYGISRPAVESLFLKAHTSQELPNVWIYMTLIITFVVMIYNKFIYRVKILKMFGLVTGLSTLLLVFLMAGIHFQVPWIYYMLYIWKDVYMVILVEIYYTYTNVSFPIKKARWLYGIFGACGALGGVIANFSVGSIAKVYGTEATLWIVVAILVLSTVLSLLMAQFSDHSIPTDLENKSSNIFKALKLIQKSSYLPYILLMVVVVQIVVTLVDFHYNAIIETVYPLTDQRTLITGQVYGTINLTTFVLHLLTGPILRLIGIPVTLLGIPLILASTLCVFIGFPGFMTVVVLKVFSKCFDYTVFKSAKECLYIPLQYNEIAQGKSIVDVIMYRFGKVGASLFVKLLVFLNASALVSWLTLSFTGLWLVITAVIVKKFRKIVSRDEEIYLK